MASSRQVVMSLASGYSKEVFERFLGSLRNCGYTGEVTVFIKENEIPTGLSALLSKYACEARTFAEYPYHPQTFRYLLYLEHLSLNKEKWGEGIILLIDFRDVLFQKNIFDYPFTWENPLYFFREDRFIGQCPHNLNWITQAFGEAEAKDLKDRHIVCSGTTLGTYAGIVGYLSTFEALAAKIDREVLKRWGGIDQGIHNYIYYREKCGPVSLLDNETGPVNTLAYAQSKVVDAQGNILSARGQISQIAHQVDRLSCEQLQKLRLAKPYPMDDLIQNSIRLELGCG